MSGIDLYVSQESIKSYLQTTFPNHQTITGATYDDESLVRVNGTLLPYITLRFGTLLPRLNDRSMGGYRQDGYFSTCDVGVVAPNDDDMRALLAVVTDRLINFQPEGAARLHLALYAPPLSFTIFAKAKPSAYFSANRYEFNINAEDVGSYIPQP